MNNLFDRLPTISSSQGSKHQINHELVLFDINRYAEIEPLMKDNPSAWMDPMLKREDLTFMLTLLSNKSLESEQVIADSRMVSSSVIKKCNTGLSWPKDLYSLSHVALPIPPDDPVYGDDDVGSSPGIELGDLAMRGEKGVLQVSASDMLRLRYNPFHSYLEQRILAFTALEPDPDDGCL
ncbi:MAG: hypothetical protein ACI8PB_005342 [Desulforhopalus sp.]